MRNENLRADDGSIQDFDRAIVMPMPSAHENRQSVSLLADTVSDRVVQHELRWLVAVRK